MLGRMRMGKEFPPPMGSYINVYFTVEDTDAAVARATELGGVPRFGPMTTPFGGFAALSDPQGANFSVIDLTTTEGETSKLTEVGWGRGPGAVSCGPRAPARGPRARPRVA